jgi:hypothetical protein
MTTWPARFVRTASLAAVAIVATSAPILAATQPPAARYLVTATMSRADGPQSAHDIVTLSASGASMASNNAAIATCFNTATSVLADALDPQPGPAIAVSFNGNSVAIPLHMKSALLPNGFNGITINGGIEGTFTSAPQTGIAILIDGDVIANKNELVGAQFRETSVEVDSHQPIAQASCTIARIVDIDSGTPI